MSAQRASVKQVECFTIKRSGLPNLTVGVGDFVSCVAEGKKSKPYLCRILELHEEWSKGQFECWATFQWLYRVEDVRSPPPTPLKENEVFFSPHSDSDNPVGSIIDLLEIEFTRGEETFVAGPYFNRLHGGEAARGKYERYVCNKTYHPTTRKFTPISKQDFASLQTNAHLITEEMIANRKKKGVASSTVQVFDDLALKQEQPHRKRAEVTSPKKPSPPPPSRVPPKSAPLPPPATTTTTTTTSILPEPAQIPPKRRKVSKTVTWADGVVDKPTTGRLRPLHSFTPLTPSSEVFFEQRPLVPARHELYLSWNGRRTDQGPGTAQQLPMYQPPRVRRAKSPPPLPSAEALEEESFLLENAPGGKDDTLAARVGFPNSVPKAVQPLPESARISLIPSPLESVSPSPPLLGFSPITPSTSPFEPTVTTTITTTPSALHGKQPRASRKSTRLRDQELQATTTSYTGKVQIGADFQATALPPFTPKTAKMTTGDQTLFSPSSIAGRSPLPIPPRPLKCGDVFGACITDTETKNRTDRRRMLWCRIEQTGENYVRGIPIDASWSLTTTTSLDGSTKGSTGKRTPPMLFSCGKDDIFVSEQQREEALYLAHQKVTGAPFATSLIFQPSALTSHVEDFCSEQVWSKWTSQEFAQFCEGMKRLTTHGALFSNLARIIKTKTVEDVVKLYYAPKRLLSNAPAWFTVCSTCRLQASALAVCQQYYQCQTALCKQCIQSEFGCILGEESERKASQASGSFERTRGSMFFCKTCFRGEKHQAEAISSTIPTITTVKTQEREARKERSRAVPAAAAAAVENEAKASTAAMMVPSRSLDLKRRHEDAATAAPASAQTVNVPAIRAPSPEEEENRAQGMLEVNALLSHPALYRVLERLQGGELDAGAALSQLKLLTLSQARDLATSATD